MAQQADTGGVGGAPFAKFTQLGDRLVGAFAGGAQRQQQDFKTRELKLKKDGKPLMEEVAHFVAMPGTTAQTGDVVNGKGDPIKPGDHVRYAFAGFKWKQAIDGRKALPEYSGFKAGTSCSGDVYTIELVGWSTETESPQAATNAGFTVVDGRIVIRTEADREKYVLAKVKQGGEVNLGKDLAITVRRPNGDEKAWEQQADALFVTRPWEKQAALVGGGAPDVSDEEPFLVVGDRRGGSYRNMDVLG